MCDGPSRPAREALQGPAGPLEAVAQGAQALQLGTLAHE